MGASHGRERVPLEDGRKHCRCQNLKTVTSQKISNENLANELCTELEMRIIVGFVVAFAVGALCRLARIPSPAPNAILGSLLVVATSVGYVLTDRWLG
jgi:XapX domain-containing protein